MTTSNESNDRLARIEALVESNALAIAAMREREEAANQRLRESINDVIQMIGDLAEQQQETDQRFNNLLAEARADRNREDAARQENRQEHREFRAFMRQTLQELRQIWQRIAS